MKTSLVLVPCFFVVAAALVGCGIGGAPPPSVARSRSETASHASTRPPRGATAAVRVDKGPGPGEGGFFPLAYARQRGDRIDNREAPIPIQCYTDTEGHSNPCWTCHTTTSFPNLRDDADLQREYSFSEYGKDNRWTNLFVDRSEAIAAIDDAAMQRWIRQDNYSLTQAVLVGKMPRWGYAWDLDVHRGFDDQGFARDGSGWRAFRYKPFPGAFWPTNGSTDDVFVRLPLRFRGRHGEEVSEIYKANLAVLEASLASDPDVADDAVRWRIEPIDERTVGADLNGDGALTDRVDTLVGLPTHYFGAAAAQPVRRGVFPEGTEFLHSVRYVDPSAVGMISVRMKELRYLRREHELPRRRYFSKYDQEAADKEEGVLPHYQGNAETGLLSTFGWRVQGYIEDADGRLRLQSQEEHYACMGCHFGIGVTADGTFSFARKVPGAEGWRYQDIRGIPDVPQQGHEDPEALTYLERVGAGDELRSNGEMLARWFLNGSVREAEVRRAGPRGDRDLGDLVFPSTERAYRLNKATMVLVAEQSFEAGRDVTLAPPTTVLRRVDALSTGLAEAGHAVHDGTVRLDWSGTEFAAR